MIRMRLTLIIIFGSTLFSCNSPLPEFNLTPGTQDALKILEPDFEKNLNLKRHFQKNSICEFLAFVNYLDTSSIIIKSQYSADIKSLILSDVKHYFSLEESCSDQECYPELEKLMALKKAYIFPRVTKNDKIFYHVKNGNWEYLTKKALEPGTIEYVRGLGIVLVSLIVFLTLYFKWKKK